MSKEIRMLMGMLKMTVFITFFAVLIYLAQTYPRVMDRTEVEERPADPTYATLQR